MSVEPTRNLAESVHQRLLNRARERGVDFNGLLVQYVVERFLYRLSMSSVADQHVLKGAMLFRVWDENLHRPTRDVDLLGFGDPSPEAVADAVRTIITTPVDPDGLVFDAEAVSATEIRGEQEYRGVRVRCMAHLGNAKIPVQIDFGFGDAVTPHAERRSFPTLLDQGAPVLAMYPPDTVAAEKIHVIAVHGIANSRMKDFYDLLVISRRFDPGTEPMAKAIKATLDRRGTELPDELPVGFTDEFANDNLKQQQWAAFLERLQIADAPADLTALIAELRGFVGPALERLRADSL